MVTFIDKCHEAVRAAGELLIEQLGKVSIRLKSPADLVTDADLAAQKLVVDTLRSAFPEHQILGEEDLGEETPDITTAEYCWIVDPLDGTTNFAHTAPHFSVSLALVHRGQLEVASVFDPTRDELFSAVAGRGATLNGAPIHTSKITQTNDALGAIGFPPAADRRSPDLQAFLNTIPHFQALRRTGSAALNLAYVAAGRFDAAWAYSTRVWDMAAGILLVSEAGGRVLAPSGEKLDLRSGQFLVAATDQLASQTAAILNPSNTTE